jgi:hypothetical protein
LPADATGAIAGTIVVTGIISATCRTEGSRDEAIKDVGPGWIHSDRRRVD